VKELKISKGYTVLIDDDDFDRVSAHWWQAVEQPHTVYAIHRRYRDDGTRAAIRLHRFVMNAPDGVEVDHINHNGLDCRKSNLRFATRQQNSANCRRRSGQNVFKGVEQDSRTNRFRAYITYRTKRYSIGYFATAEEAALAYDERARDYFGEFAALNFPEPGERAA
jgi:hypothetical protein